MLLLVVDTSGRQGSVALAACTEPNSCDIIVCAPLTGGTFSAELVPRIADLLSEHGFSRKQIDGFVVVSGPGSFTGLRIGLAAIKALAEILEKPIATVSLLEALALISGIEGKVLTAIDAGRNQSYVGEYEVRGSHAKLIAESLLDQNELLEAGKDVVVVTSDKVIADAVRIRDLRIKEVAPPGVEIIAKRGYEKIIAGKIVTPEGLEANYIRRSDPEVLREKQFLAGSS